MPPDPDPAPDKGPSLHHLHTLGRTDIYTSMRPAELTALINALQQET